MAFYIDTVDSTGYVGDYSSLELSPLNDVPEISYYDQTNNKLKYAEKNPATGWWSIPLDSGGKYTSLATDASGHPHICYNSDDGNIGYVFWDGNWQYEPALLGAEAGSLEIDNVRPAIAFMSGSKLFYARRICYPTHPPVPATCLFVSESVDTAGYVQLRPDISLTFTSSTRPHIAYLDEAGFTVKYATEDANGWHITEIEHTSGASGFGISIALDSSDNPAISYQTGSSRDLKFAWKDTAGWHTMTVDSAGLVGYWSSLAFDSSGNAHISYSDSTNGMLKYAKGTPVKSLPSYVNSPTDPDGDGIYEDLNANGRLDFADVVLYFNQMTWIAANEPIAAFDLNGNSRIDFADIVALFNEI